MRKLSLTCLTLLLMLAACTPYMYGVPQQTWDRMSEPERIEAMRVYERDQQARRQAAEERARRQAIEEQARRQAAEERARHEAMERERAQARQALLEHERRERIEAIHRGDGAYGQLIRVRLQGGRIRVGDRLHRFEPLTFTIAEGEIRRIDVTGHKVRVPDLTASYAGGTLSLEGAHFSYDKSWGRGRLYPDTGITGALELRGVDLSVEVHGRSNRFEREPVRLVVIPEPQPPVVIREKEHPKPPPVIVRDRETPKPPPAVVRDKEPVRPPVRPPAPPAADHAPRSVEIVFLSGEIKVHGQSRLLERTTLRMTDGESRELSLKAGPETRTLSLHYGNGELFIDGTPGRGRDAVRLSFEKEWKGGKVYRISLKGRVQLEKLELKVTGIAN
ncbi:MAG: hypothetical protein IPQ16_00710 [Geobacteraceae bacterium]|nr:hypothetical protein [Geobacteraceae bacterium]